MFKSFYIAGFECATGYNVHRKWIDSICSTQHDVKLRDDYSLLKRCGIHVARESVRWPLVNPRGGKYDFDTVKPVLEAAEEFDIELIHDLFHYGFPQDVDLMSDKFPERFSDYCFEAARYISRRTKGTCYFTPVNEPSYFAWAGGHAAMFAPYLTDMGYELKVQLSRAAIQGIEAIWAANKDARIVNVDPICHVAPPADRPDLQPEADRFNDVAVFESLDMICGMSRPELGGSRKHLDIVGINYYWTNQWELGSPEIPLGEDDPRCAPLSKLIRSVYDRYGGDVLITETSHSEERRAEWLDMVSEECWKVLAMGIPLRGVCLYPILGMPEWHVPDEWVRMGLWDLVECREGLLRVLHEPTFEALCRAQASLSYLDR